MAKNREMLGKKYNHGRVWPVWGHGPAFSTFAGDDFEVGKK